MPYSVASNFSSLKTDPIRNFKFIVEIRHAVESGGGKKTLSTLGFTSVSGLSMTTESIPYRQGGYNTTVHQIPGQTTFSPVTLQRGVTLGSSMSWHWMRQLFSVVAGNGNFNGGVTPPGDQFRCSVDIMVLDHPITMDVSNNDSAGQTGSQPGVATPVRMRFRLYNAWISALSYSDLNAGDNALLVEQMTLVHEGFDLKFSKDGPGQEAQEFVVG